MENDHPGKLKNKHTRIKSFFETFEEFQVKMRQFGISSHALVRLSKILFSRRENLLLEKREGLPLLENQEFLLIKSLCSRWKWSASLERNQN